MIALGFLGLILSIRFNPVILSKPNGPLPPIVSLP
jgi:hypothetical protein